MTSEACGAMKRMDGGLVLVCNLDVDHAGDRHGMREHATSAPYVTWPIGVHVVSDQHVIFGRLHKSKRRTYETKAMWKARQM